MTEQNFWHISVIIKDGELKPICEMPAAWRGRFDVNACELPFDLASAEYERLEKNGAPNIVLCVGLCPNTKARC